MKFLKRVSCCLFLIAILGACNSSSSDSVPVILPIPASHLIASTGEGLQIKGINDSAWTKLDGTSGKNWAAMIQLADGTLLADVSTSTYDPNNPFPTPTTKYEGIYRSEDTGTTWTAVDGTKDIGL